MENLAIWHFEESAWKSRLNQSDDFRHFRSIHTELNPSVLWQIPVKKPNTLELCSFVAKLCSTTDNVVLCPRCSSISRRDLLKHLLSDCQDSVTQLELVTFWQNVNAMFGDIIHTILHSMELKDFITFILGGLLPTCRGFVTREWIL